MSVKGAQFLHLACQGGAARPRQLRPTYHIYALVGKFDFERAVRTSNE